MQQRLLTLVGMLLLVFVLMSEARRPDRWTWLWQFSSDTPAPLPLSDESESSEPGAYDRGRLPGFDPGRLAEIRDNSYFRTAEKEVWFDLWDVVRKTPSPDLRSLSLGPVSFLQIDQQTASYRGRIVTLRGRLRTAFAVSAPPNDVGIEGYTQCWLTLDDSPSNVVVVYVLQHPEVQDNPFDVNLPVTVTGVVYKRWSYSSKDGLRNAPVVLAQKIDVVREDTVVAESARASEQSPWMMMTLLTAILSALLVAGLYIYTGRRFGLHRQTRDLPSQIEWVDTIPDEGCSNSVSLADRQPTSDDTVRP